MPKYTFKSAFATDFEYIPPKNGCLTVLYLHGFCSDCWGKKPETVKAFCLKNGVGLFRFDYAGHGSDRANFEKADFKIWKEQVLEVIDRLSGDLVCVGSSMGGWLALIAALERPERIKAVIGLAAAPNFVKLFAGLVTPEQKASLQNTGKLVFGTKDFSYTITQRFIDTAMAECLPEGENCWRINCPVHLIQGMKDDSLPWRFALAFAQALTSANVAVKLLKSSDHRLNDEAAVAELENSLAKLVNI